MTRKEVYEADRLLARFDKITVLLEDARNGRPVKLVGSVEYEFASSITARDVLLGVHANIVARLTELGVQP